MKLTYRIAYAVARRLKGWADRGRLGKVDAAVFDYPDCLTTVMAINKYHTASRLCDIGAHKGRWSFVMHQLNTRLESVVMFEPQAKLYDELQACDVGRAEKKIYRCALGDAASRQMIMGGTASASLFETTGNQSRFFPGSIEQVSEPVEVRTLDEVYSSERLEYPDLIKMDVQGYELSVLRGARNVLANARYLVIELALREFYKGQPPLSELLKFLEEERFVMLDHGFECRSHLPPYELLQLDAIFMNTRFADDGK